jgi:hypothetical protein
MDPHEEFRMHRSRIVAFALVSLFLLPPAVHAAGALSGIDLMSSTIMAKGQSSFSGIALRARVKSARLIPQIELMPSFEYWRNSSTLHPYDIKASRKDATLAFDARFNFNGSTWRPYVGAGWAVHFLSSEVDAPSLGIPHADDSLIKGNLAALGGVSYALNDRIDNLLEIKYHHLSDYRQLKINWGLAFKL